MVVKPTDSNNIIHGSCHCTIVNRSCIELYYTVLCNGSICVVLVLRKSGGANCDCFTLTKL